MAETSQTSQATPETDEAPKVAPENISEEAKGAESAIETVEEDVGDVIRAVRKDLAKMWPLEFEKR